MKKILYLGGEYDYSTDLNTQPVMKRLEEMGASITTKGGSFDFFIPDLMPNMVKNWYECVPEKLSHYDVIYFADFWNMAIPFFNYRKYAEKVRVPMVSLFNGSVTLKDDVAIPIPQSNWYEKYLTMSYDHVIVPSLSFSEPLIANTNFETECKFHSAPLPTNVQFERIRPEPKVKKRIIFSHRFNPDKGCIEFLHFVKYSEDRKLGIEFIATQDMSLGNPEWIRLGKELGVKFTGKLPLNEFKEICSDGGYSWSSAYSETFGYAILDLISFGLTPILNKIPAYHFYPRKFFYKNWFDVYEIIESGLVFTQKDWEELKEKIKDGDKKIAEIIYNAD